MYLSGIVIYKFDMIILVVVVGWWRGWLRVSKLKEGGDYQDLEI